ncbi:MAG: hypothetical protein EZS28_043591 [Streblomastix strix]|uniref:Tyr recombinase domain-containing protein n=1 Tax=Streblomastix strix TaxID=222440 RepID=A0A5J4TSM0_9EUKA|nr:MAG: hypothetical protein EZS28_043591 [Streblomastix strix]
MSKKLENQASLGFCTKTGKRNRGIRKSLNKQFPKDTDYLLWHKGFNKPITTKDISILHAKLLKKFKIFGASAYFIRISATAELAKLGIPERDLATFTHQSQNSRTAQQYYIFASSSRANDIAGQLTNIQNQDNERLNQVFKQRSKIRREGGNQQLSSFPEETAQLFVILESPYLTSGSPKICISI